MSIVSSQLWQLGGQAVCPGALQVTHLHPDHVHHVLAAVAAGEQAACFGAIQVTHLYLDHVHHVLAAVAAGGKLSVLEQYR
jgi:hypothetical protein